MTLRTQVSHDADNKPGLWHARHAISRLAADIKRNAERAALSA